MKDAFETLFVQLEDAKQTSSGTDTSNIRYINPTTVEHTGKRGRPRKVIDPNFMVEATRPSRNLTLTTLAKSLGVHRNTVQSYLKEYGISRKFSDVPDGDLDTLITGLRASTNNRAETVLEMFLDAALAYGLPSRVRGDRGGENRDVSMFMILSRGPNRASFVWGPSTNNTRIERVWGEVGGQFARAWRGFFLRLERQHHLDRKNPHHRWILHFLFLGEGHDQSPDDLRFLGSLQNGIYKDESAGAYKKTQPHGDEPVGTSGSEVGSEDRMDVDVDAGEQSGGEDDDEWYDEYDEPKIDRQWNAASAETTLRHKPVKVPHSVCPFDEAGRQLFETAVSVAQEHNVVPAGYGVLPDEWDGDGYPSEEIITSGKKGGKELRVALPIKTWKPRAERWAQALHAYTMFDELSQMLL
ncbi:hypothetical protein EYR40_007469 [Pleurotus pulmonarius]|nr:hypothetical protein EYR40_007469 [Pleurotus pulmonarius]